MRLILNVLLLAIASPAATAGLKFGSAIANLRIEEGETVLASQFLDLAALRPSAIASLEGRMDNIDLEADAFIRSQLLQRSAIARSQVEFTDTVTVTAPGVPPGARLNLRLSFYLNGTTFLDTRSSIHCSARIAAVGPNKQRWEQSETNDGTPVIDDSNGTVIFEIPVREGDPSRSDILIAFTAESIAGLPGSIFGSSYFSRADCSLNAQFLSAKVADENGKILPIWKVVSQSRLNYGKGDEPAVLSTPTPAISFPEDAPGMIRLTWQTSELEEYTLESSPDLVNWSTAATIDGDDLTAVVELPHPGDHHFYRLVTTFNSGGGIWTP